MTRGMVMILSGLLKYVRSGLNLKRFEHILIRVEGGTGTEKNRVPTPFCEKTFMLVEEPDCGQPMVGSMVGLMRMSCSVG